MISLRPTLAATTLAAVLVTTWAAARPTVPVTTDAAPANLAPPAAPRPDVEGAPRPVEAPFSGFVFKVQAGMNKAHRDHVAFIVDVVDVVAIEADQGVVAFIPIKLVVVDVEIGRASCRERVL